MTSRDFCFWVQGYLEVSALNPSLQAGLNQSQVECIQKHLALVFVHEIDPSMPNKTLDDIHAASEEIFGPPRPGYPGGFRC